jgi:L-aminopeptidase/D-esterase-like protein
MIETFNMTSGEETRLPEGFRVGNYGQAESGTGCTVLICPEGATGAVAVRGGAPATRETDLLDPVNTVDALHAVVLSGGSAFGLAASTGVVHWLEEHGIGLKFIGQCIPIVSGACIFDLPFGDPSVRPDAEWGYKACEAAGFMVQTGNVGAGTGATVGKLLGADWAMKAGLGAASLGVGELVVSAFAVVNALGNVYSGSRSRMVAGVRDPERPLSILDPYQALFTQAKAEMPEKESPLLTEGGRAAPVANTTICCVLTNAAMSKTQANRVASMAHDGFARSIEPVHTANDGDAVFVMASGRLQVSADLIGILAARAVEAAIINAALDAEAAFGLPASRDLLEK